MKSKGEGMAIHTARRALFLFDLHVPTESKKCIAIAKEFRDDFRPDIVVAGGDWQNVDQLDRFSNESETALLDEFEKVKYYVELFGVTHYLEGNHEERLRRIGLTDKRLRSLLSLDRNLELSKRGIPIFPYHPKKGILKLGKLKVLHGFYTNKYVAAKTAEAFGCCIFGHSHVFQTYTPKISDKWSTGWSIGCMCELIPSYMEKYGPNGWMNGFAFGYIYKSGNFSLYPVRIIGGRIMINDKEYTYGVATDES